MTNPTTTLADRAEKGADIDVLRQMVTIMETVDNAVMLAIPGAMDATLLSLYFWRRMAVALALASVAAFTVNRWLIARGKGDAVVHAHH